MVLLRSHEGRWNSFRQAARAGLIGLAILSLGATDKGGDHHPKDSKGSTNSAQHASTHYPISITLFAGHDQSDSKNHQPDSPAEKEGFWGLSYEGWVALSTVVLTVATIALGIFTLLLWLASRDQHDRIQESITLARNEFLATHRPRIIFREAIIGSLLEGEEIIVYFTLANVGETVGTIVNSFLSLEVVSEESERLFLQATVEPHTHLANVTLGPGVQSLFKYPHTDAPIWNKGAFGKRGQRGPLRTIHLSGQILYKDSIGVHRRTAFRRVLRPERQRFYRLPDDYEPDLDYAD